MMRRILFPFLLLIGILLIDGRPASAQWLGTVSIESGYDDNMFHNYSATESGSTDVTLMYGYFPEDGNWALNYTGALSTFSQYPDRLYATNTLGASWSHAFGDEDVNSISLMSIGSMRLDAEDYTLYDYSQALASLSLKQQLIGDLPLLASYRVRYRSYPNFGELSYLEHFASIGTMLFFETRTSIRVQADYGFKNYLTSSPVDPALSGSGFTSTQSGLTVDGGGNGGGGNGGGGNGSGSGTGSGGGGNGSGSGRMSMGGNGNSSGMEGSVEYLMFEDPSTSQLSAWINVGQGITDATGLSFRYLQRWNLTDRGRAFVGGAVDFIGEEELFDDPYSYESNEFTLSLTQVLPWEMRLKAGGYFLHKTYGYPSTLDYTDPSVASRADDRMGGWMTVSKSIGGDWLLFEGLDLSVGYVYLRNQSNTSYYDYSSNAMSIGISTNF
ncbi:MAG: hypothetical protein WC824_14945 [Bacteroidota bacterium]|jgi:hypothetical protein